MTDEDFDLIAFAEGYSTASAEVDIYMDEDSALRASRLVRRNKQGKAMGVAEEDRAAYEELRQKVRDSRQTIHLAGLKEGRLEEIEEELEMPENRSEATDDQHEAWVLACLTDMYVKTVRASDGAVSDKKYTTEDWKRFQKVAPPSQWNHLLSEVARVAYASVVIDESVDPAFLASS